MYITRHEIGQISIMLFGQVVGMMRRRWTVAFHTWRCITVKSTSKRAHNANQMLYVVRHFSNSNPNPNPNPQLQTPAQVRIQPQSRNPCLVPYPILNLTLSLMIYASSPKRPVLSSAKIIRILSMSITKIHLIQPLLFFD